MTNDENSIHIAQLLQACDRRFEAVGFNCPLMGLLAKPKLTAREAARIAKLTKMIDKIHAGYGFTK